MTGDTLQRMAQASSWSEETRSARVVLSTDAADVGDGFQLVHTRAAIRWPERPVPVVLDHRREIGAVIGAVSDLALEPLNGGSALVGRLQLDGPAADQALPLLRTGAARWSIGARIHKTAESVGRALTQATDWSIGHLALVVEPADVAAITRSINHPETMNNETSISNTETTERSAKEIRRENAILRIAQAAEINDQEQIDRWVNSDLPVDRVSYEAVRALRIRIEGGDVRDPNGPEPIGHPARMHATPATRRDLQGILAAKMNIKGDDVDRSLAGIPMHLVLRDHLANDPNSRGLDLAAMPVTKLVNRAFSTSDFTQALEATTERALMSAYQEAQSGVLALATSRDLPDFRAMEMIRVSQYGAISEKKEGGEYKTSKFSEENAASLKAAEYGAIQPLTRKALANDNLGIFAEMMAEMGRSCARKERSELAARLLNNFTWGAKNSDTTTGALAMDFINGIIKGTLKLRRQTDVDGNAVSFEPRLLLVAPEQEAIARMALGEYVPNNGDDVMPFRTLRVEVDHYLPGGSFYLCDSSYPQLVIGRIGGGPVITDDEEFSTGNRLYRVQHDFGTAVLDQRSIVKLTIAEA
jgi:hypothetical protein